MFLWVFSALAICSTLIYGIVLTVLPRQYQITSDRRLDNNIEILVSELHNMRYENAVSEINNFCIQNNVAAMLSNEKGAVSFGEIEAEELSVATSNVTTTVTFSDSGTEYALVVSSISQTADIILSLMLRFLPVVLAIIILLSFFSTFICSKVIVTPIAKISQISKRMTAFDRTWKCDIKSSDEIGVLVSSLNTMASRLQDAIEELTNANHQLTDDVEKFKALEEQRKHFLRQYLTS